MTSLSFPQVVDNSMMNDIRGCLQKGFRAHLQDWKPQGESVHLHAGGAFAEGLEAARHAFYEEGVDSETAVARGLNALLLAYGDFIPPEGSAKSAERDGGALEFYFDEWPMGDAQGAHPNRCHRGERAIEFSFAQPLDFQPSSNWRPHHLRGRSDMICDFAGGIYVEDDKTATSAW